MKNNFEKIYGLLENSESILIVSHIRPDGDALGSSIGSYLVLSKLFPDKKIEIFLDENISHNLRKLVDDSKVGLYDEQECNRFDVLFALDCGNYHRLALPKELSCGKIINIDHHATNDFYGELNIVFNDISSTAELIYRIFEKDVTKENGFYFLFGICSDTGFFRNDNVTPSTLRATANITELGANISSVSHYLENSKKMAELKVLSLGLSKIRKIKDGAYMVEFSLEDWKRFDEPISVIWTSGIFHQVRSLADCEIGIFVIQKDEKEVLVEFRSKNIDSSKIALHFGGGGHKKASGCTILGSFREAVNKLEDYIMDKEVSWQ